MGTADSTYQLNSNKKIEYTEPIQEAIYDFGGANVKSCASIALNKSISKGLIPPGTILHQWKTPTNNFQKVIIPPSTISHKTYNSSESFRG